MGVQKVIILGVTGSIGDSALKIIRANRDLFKIVAISYHANGAKANEIINEFSIPNAFCSGPGETPNGNECTFHQNYESLLSVDYDMVIIAVVGSAGVIPAFYAAGQGKKILLANKESLVMAGSIIMRTAKNYGTEILPVDSEHNSLFRLLAGIPGYKKLIITASGGSLRTLPLEKLKSVSVKDVLNHPTWSMGAKITVDSATMVNKSLEIIEARHLFNKSFSELDAIVHPESYVHAILRHNDGSSFFHVYKPDMTYSIAYCMFYPELSPGFADSPQMQDFPSLTFQKIDSLRYPGYFLGINAGRQEGIYPAVFNAANEQAVFHFLENQIRYTDIIPLVSNALDRCAGGDFEESLDGLFKADRWARDYVKRCIHI